MKKVKKDGKENEQVITAWDTILADTRIKNALLRNDINDVSQLLTINTTNENARY